MQAKTKPKHTTGKYEQRALRRVLQLVSRELGVQQKHIMSTVREERIVIARHLCAWLLYYGEKLTLTQIAELLKRDHSSVLYAIQNIEDQRQIYQKFRVGSDMLMEKYMDILKSQNTIRQLLTRQVIVK